MEVGLHISETSDHNHFGLASKRVNSYLQRENNTTGSSISAFILLSLGSMLVNWEARQGL